MSDREKFIERILATPFTGEIVWTGERFTNAWVQREWENHTGFNADYERGRASRDAEVAGLKAEMDEQCRIIGMSGERELALRSEIDRLRAERDVLRGALQWYSKREHYLDDPSDYVEPAEKLIGGEVCLTIIDEAGKDAGERARNALAQADKIRGEQAETLAGIPSGVTFPAVTSETHTVYASREIITPKEIAMVTDMRFEDKGNPDGKDRRSFTKATSSMGAVMGGEIG